MGWWLGRVSWEPGYMVMKDVVQMGRESRLHPAVWTAEGMASNVLCPILAPTHPLHRPNDGCFLYTATPQWWVSTVSSLFFLSLSTWPLPFSAYLEVSSNPHLQAQVGGASIARRTKGMIAYYRIRLKSFRRSNRSTPSYPNMVNIIGCVVLGFTVNLQ